MVVSNEVKASLKLELDMVLRSVDSIDAKIERVEGVYRDVVWRFDNKLLKLKLRLRDLSRWKMERAEVKFEDKEFPLEERILGVKCEIAEAEVLLDNARRVLNDRWLGLKSQLYDLNREKVKLIGMLPEKEVPIRKQDVVLGRCVCDYSERGIKLDYILSCPLTKGGACLRKGDNKAESVEQGLSLAEAVEVWVGDLKRVKGFSLEKELGERFSCSSSEKVLCQIKKRCLGKGKYAGELCSGCMWAVWK